MNLALSLFLPVSCVLKIAESTRCFSADVYDSGDRNDFQSASAQEKFVELILIQLSS